MGLPEEYKAVGRVIRRYWRNYGGFSALFSSPYFYFSVVFGVLFFPYDFDKGNEWWQIAMDILPNVVGFSLGGYAIFLAFGDEKFKRLIAVKDEDAVDVGKSNEKPSPYLSFSVAFLHFTLMQLFALFLALAGNSLTLVPGKYADLGIPWVEVVSDVASYAFGLLAYTVFVYALSLAVAATFSIYRLVYLYDQHLQVNSEDPHGSGG